jgi:Arc/MetJ-type ribon-helix-helix transcriptional regulator
MKQKISVTIDEKTRKMIEKEVAKGLFRNISHAVEFSLNKIIKGETK